MELSSVSDVDRPAVPGSAGGAAEATEAADQEEAGPACSIDDARRSVPAVDQVATRPPANEPPPGPATSTAVTVREAASRDGAAPADRDGAGGLAAPVRLDDRPSRGELTAPVVLVEYGDFECPYCAQAAPVLHELVETCGGLVRHVFRHFPLFEVHPYALTAALAAEVAHAHDRFWPMHDQLFAYQSRLKDIDLRMRAERLGLDPGLVVGAAAQPYGTAVEADYEHGVGVGVRGTPTIFINGQAYRGRTELPALRRAVHLAATSAIVASPPLPRLTVPDGPPILVLGVAEGDGPNGAARLESVPLSDGAAQPDGVAQPTRDAQPESDQRPANASADSARQDDSVSQDDSASQDDDAQQEPRRDRRRLPWSRR
ncbi:DsbA family protein [Frankia sp. AgB1.9]|uniref:DsbA family protein n=1 Tax=unclassified Frankia TaxID=2632575 RepID=UPI001933342B|nr:MULTISPECIES: DsbA family protein [unclassified Frankia]MBL7490607.1 DsbA family protein [Frankia sp. AgW1.1]MBL7553544.1 DsbA family protein [Frankia sp. AgB1.9]MBL7617799.1 DsbA family protein [Frankia sp. AgB1.8]